MQRNKKATTKLRLNDFMTSLEEAEKSAEGEPAGIVTKSADGRLFFIPESQISSFAIPSNTLYELYRAAPPRRQPRDLCADEKRWLDTHSPKSKVWRLRCIMYFEDCV